MRDPLRFNDPESNPLAPGRVSPPLGSDGALVTGIYTQPAMFPPRFQRIKKLPPEMVQGYRQLSQQCTARRLRQNLMESLAPDLRNWVTSIASMWQIYGISTVTAASATSPSNPNSLSASVTRYTS